MRILLAGVLHRYLLIPVADVIQEQHGLSMVCATRKHRCEYDAG